MRNRYVMVLGTYGRWEYAWTLAAIPLWIFITVVSSRVDGAENFLLGPGWAFIAFFVLNFSALLLNGHLIGMIGSARGRLTPGLRRRILWLPPRSRAS